MKYEVFDLVMEITTRYVTVLVEEGNAKTFPADKSNADYIQFLADAQLTDAKVKKLTPDVWYDFPEALPVEPPVEEEVI